MDSCCEHSVLPVLAGLVLLIIDLVVLKMQNIYIYVSIYICIYLFICVYLYMCIYAHLHPLFSFLCLVVFTWLEGYLQGMLSN